MSYELIYDHTPVARKAHRCIWCGGDIAVNEKHRHEISKFEGTFQDHRWHLDCNSAANEFFNDNGGESEFEPYINERPVTP